MPSILEGYPNSLIEAMYTNLIPFTTDAGDSYKIIENNRGIKISDFSSRSISRTLEEHFANISIKDEYQMQVNIQQFIDKELNDETIFHEWRKLV